METKKFKNEDERKKILERIKKILAVAKGTPFEGEADTAMKMAQSYMSQYGLSMTDVEVGDMLNEEIVHENVEREISPETWEKILCSAVGVVCDCKAVENMGWRSSRMSFIGFKSDVGMAKILFSCLYVGVNSSARKTFPDDRSARKSFRYGCALRLLERAKMEKVEAVKEPTGRYELVIVAKKDKVQKWAEENKNLKNANSKSRQNINPIGFFAGKAHANKMDLMNKEKVEDKTVLALGHSKGAKR